MDNLKSTRTIHNTIWDDKSQSLIVKTCVMHYTVNDDLLEVNFLELFQSSFSELNSLESTESIEFVENCC